jgi:hypothetical protein
VAHQDLHDFLHGVLSNVRDSVVDILVAAGRFGDLNQWYTFHILFSAAGKGTGGEARYVLVLSCNTGAVSDWVMIDVSSGFSFDDDLMVLRRCTKTFVFGEDCDTLVSVLPHAMTSLEAVEIKTLGWIIAADRLALLYKIALPPPPLVATTTLAPTLASSASSASSLATTSSSTRTALSTRATTMYFTLPAVDAGVPGMSTTTAAANIVSAITKGWKEVVDAFKTTSSSTLVKTITRRGFTKLAVDCTVRSTNKNRFLSQSPVFPSATFGTVPFAFCGQFFCHHDAVRHAALPFEL